MLTLFAADNYKLSTILELVCFLVVEIIIFCHEINIHLTVHRYVCVYLLI